MSESLHLREEIVAPNVLRWVLCNPARRNALGPAELAFLRSRSATLRGEVVLIAADGDVFCSGFDLRALAENTDERAATCLPDASLIAATSAMRHANATFVALVHGPTLGAGVELVSRCDLRIATPAATFTLPASKLGVVYHPDGLARITAIFGAKVTRKLLLLGATIDACEADACGALDALVEADALASAGEAIAARLLANVPQALAAHREHLRAASFPLDHDDWEARRVAAYASDAHRLAREALRKT